MSLFEKLIAYYKRQFAERGEDFADLRESRAVNEASAIWQARWSGRAAERRAANSPWEPKP